MKCVLNAILLAAALTVPAHINAQDRDNQTRHYEDKAHNDSHEWNDAEDKAYRRYLEEHHKKYHDFDKASKKEQADYWKWRHSHPDQDRH
jgi:type III secretory pathway component EscR